MTGYDQLLRGLDAEPMRAAEQFELLRGKLIAYFIHYQCVFPEDLADETLNRAERRLQAGVEVFDTLAAYCYGIARNVRRESARAITHEHQQRERLRQTLESSLASNPERALVEREEEQRRSSCVRECLRRLPADERALFLDSFDESAARQALRRQELAERMALTAIGLRSRVHRIRQQLQRCANGCLARGAKESGTI